MGLWAVRHCSQRVLCEVCVRVTDVSHYPKRQAVKAWSVHIGRESPVPTLISMVERTALTPIARRLATRNMLMRSGTATPACAKKRTARRQLCVDEGRE